VAGGLRAACNSGNTLADECAYGDATGVTHSDFDARAHVHCNAYTGANYHRCAAHSDAERDVHSHT